MTPLPIHCTIGAINDLLEIGVKFLTERTLHVGKLGQGESCFQLTVNARVIRHLVRGSRELRELRFRVLLDLRLFTHGGRGFHLAGQVLLPPDVECCVADSLAESNCG